MARRSGGSNLEQDYLVKVGVALPVKGTDLFARQQAEEMIKALDEAGFDVFYEYAVVPVEGPVHDVDGGMVPHCRAVTTSSNTNPIAHTE